MPYTTSTRPQLNSPLLPRRWRSHQGPMPGERVSASECEPEDVKILSSEKLGARIGLHPRTVRNERQSGWLKKRVEHLDANGWTDWGDAFLTRNESVPWELFVSVLDEWCDNKEYSARWVAWNIGYSNRAIWRWKNSDRVPASVVEDIFNRMARGEMPEGREGWANDNMDTAKSA